jgi:hypothetical protein
LAQFTGTIDREFRKAAIEATLAITAAWFKMALPSHIGSTRSPILVI